MTSHTPVADAAPDLPVAEPRKGLRGHPWLTLISVAIGVMMVALDGTIVAGLLVEHVNWQSVFFINVPVGILALALGLAILKDHRAENAPRSFDIPGIALLSGAMFCLIWPLIKATEWGWGDARTLG